MMMLKRWCYGLSRWQDGPHHHKWNLLLESRPMRVQHIRWQDLTLEVADRWRPRFLQITFSLQLTDTSCFEVLYCWFVLSVARVFPAEKVWYHTVSMYPSDNPCIVYTGYLDAGSHEVVVHKMTASECMSSMQMTCPDCPHHHSCTGCRNTSILLVWQILTMSVFGICSCHLMMI